MDITFPVDVSRRFVNCPATGGPCLLTITNTPPPPPTNEPTTTPTTEPTTIPTTEPTTTPTTGPSVVPTTIPGTLPSTLPATGSSGAQPLALMGLLFLPLGAALILVTRRRASTQ
jgi:LPXTG-motif cell wall-anchored protein